MSVPRKAVLVGGPHDGETIRIYDDPTPSILHMVKATKQAWQDLMARFNEADPGADPFAFAAEHTAMYVRDARSDVVLVYTFMDPAEHGSVESL